MLLSLMLHIFKYAIISHFTECGYSVPQDKYWLTLQVGKMQGFFPNTLKMIKNRKNGQV